MTRTQHKGIKRRLILSMIEDGKRSALASEKGLKLLGAMVGFHIARTSTFEELLEIQAAAGHKLMFIRRPTKISLEEYWGERWCNLQIDWVIERWKALHQEPDTQVLASAVEHVAKTILRNATP